MDARLVNSKSGIWRDMHRRCYDRSRKEYHRYGGRGIKVCQRWHNFENFFADMGERPSGMSLDRIDNDGDYSPENCRWATVKEQNNNTRANRVITFNGESKSMTQWAEEVGIKVGTIWMRLHLGWSIEETLQKPVSVKKSI